MKRLTIQGENLESLDSRKLPKYGELYWKLNKYENLEEQGTLLKLPCAVGDTVYKVSLNHVHIDTCQITGFAECDSIKSMRYTVYIDPDEEDIIALSDFGRAVFLTREEAEAALKEIGGQKIVTALEKQIKVKSVLLDMCKYGDGCSECKFFNPEDKTTGDEFWCAIRDSDSRIPLDDAWDIGSAMI